MKIKTQKTFIDTLENAKKVSEEEYKQTLATQKREHEKEIINLGVQNRKTIKEIQDKMNDSSQLKS